jgi:hypothetical protein
VSTLPDLPSVKRITGRSPPHLDKAGITQGAPCAPNPSHARSLRILCNSLDAGRRMSFWQEEPSQREGHQGSRWGRIKGHMGRARPRRTLRILAPDERRRAVRLRCDPQQGEVSAG